MATVLEDDGVFADIDDLDGVWKGVEGVFVDRTKGF
jgi:hypothetical protein